MHAHRQVRRRRRRLPHAVFTGEMVLIIVQRLISVNQRWMKFNKYLRTSSIWSSWEPDGRSSRQSADFPPTLVQERFFFFFHYIYLFFCRTTILPELSCLSEPAFPGRRWRSRTTSPTWWAATAWTGPPPSVCWEERKCDIRPRPPHRDLWRFSPYIKNFFMFVQKQNILKNKLETWELSKCETKTSWSPPGGWLAFPRVCVRDGFCYFRSFLSHKLQEITGNYRNLVVINYLML